MINKLPAPTFRWLHMNGAEVEKISDEYMDAGSHFEKSTADEDPIMLSFSFEGDKAITPMDFEVKDNCVANIIMPITTDENKDFTLEARTRITLGNNARAKLVQIQLLPKGMELRNFIDVTLEDNASFELVQVMLSAGKAYVECKSSLNGRGSSVKIDSAYMVRDGEHLDINYVADHYGCKTESAINVYGVLKGGSSKIFRGTIDFKKGAKDAVGNEQEDVLLLDDDVINQTIPLILCAEEDVEGNHGASIGSLSDDVMTYLKSRGMDESHIYEMMSRARIDAVAALMDNEEAHRLVNDFMDRI